MTSQRATDCCCRKIKDRLFSLIPKERTVVPPRYTIASDADDKTSTVLIGNIAKTVSPEDLLSLFKLQARVQEALIFGSLTTDGKHHGEVLMNSRMDAVHVCSRGKCFY